MEKYLVINAGSSSLKFSLYEFDGEKENEIVNGYVEKIGKEDSFYSLKTNDNKIEKSTLIKNHTEAVEIMLNELLSNNFINDIEEIKGIGHRVLHGGEYYDDSVILDEESISNIESLIELGPLHIPGQLAVIKSMLNVLPDASQVAVFDTTFHQTIGKDKYLYGIPYELYKKFGIRKYGFHGTSHKYITETMQKKLGKKDVNLVICHLGSGGSLCVVKDGKSFDTTMGFTPNAGIMMCTRSGDIDYSIIPFIQNKTNMNINEIDNMLNKESGLKGLAGVTDFRDLDKLIDEGNEIAKLAWEMNRLSIVKYISYYMNLLKVDRKIDGIVFTAGIGENCIRFRKGIIDLISDVKINEEENNKIARFLGNTSGKISTEDSKIPVFVEPTNEEYMILKDTVRISKEYKNNLKSKKLTN